MPIITWWRSLPEQTRKNIWYGVFVIFAIIVIWLLGSKLIALIRNLFDEKQADLPDQCEPQDSDFSFVDTLHASFEAGDFNKVQELYGAITYADKCVATRYANAWNKRWKGKGGGYGGLVKPWGNLYESMMSYGCDEGILDFTGINDCSVMQNALRVLEQHNLTTL